MYNLALLNTEQDIVHKVDFAYIIDLFTAARTRNRMLKVFCSKDLQFSISFSFISVPKILLLSVQFEKKILFHFLRLLHFQKSYMNTKLRFQVGPGTPNFSGASWPMWS